MATQKRKRGKRVTAVSMPRALIWVLTVFGFSLASAQTPCINGFADRYPCDGVDLLARLTPTELLAEEENGVLLNDVWGWTDATTGKEYVLVGMANGTSFVDISDPLNPIMLGMLPEHHVARSGRSVHDGEKSIWRDIKVYNNHAFIVSEEEGHGMQVFDLTDLRAVLNPPMEFVEAGHYGGISAAHNVVINEATGYAYVVGSGYGDEGSICSTVGGLHVVNVRIPTNPVYEACFDDDMYTHDAQCVIYAGSDADYSGKEICFNSNEDTFTIVDVDDKKNIQMISKTGYDGVAYMHQGWLTEDHNYFLSNDELDEGDFGSKTKTFIWDVRGLDTPILIGKYIHRTTAIDHNLYIVGDNVYESNYTSGLRILDISDIANANLKLVGYFDTYPSSNDPHFFGTWSNYPFFESGVIAASDITGGLFLLKFNGGVVGLDPSGFGDEFPLIYPLPAINEIKVEASHATNYKTFVIFSLNGKPLLRGNLSQQNSIDIRSLKKGMYLLELRNGSRTRMVHRIFVN